MHQPFQYVFPNHRRDVWFRRKRLKKDNPYGLPAGDYVLVDLYPTTPEDPSLIYVIVRHMKSGTPVATIALEFSPSGLQMTISREHLQSPATHAGFDLLHDTLTREPGLQNYLWEQLQEVGWMHEQLQKHPELPQSSLLSEMTIRTLAGSMEALMHECHPRQWDHMLDHLFRELKQELIAAMQQHLSEQNKVISLSDVRRQKSKSNPPD
jgi:hypothetical protein